MCERTLDIYKRLLDLTKDTEIALGLVEPALISRRGSAEDAAFDAFSHFRFFEKNTDPQAALTLTRSHLIGDILRSIEHNSRRS